MEHLRYGLGLGAALLLAGCDSGPQLRVINRTDGPVSFKSGGWPTNLKSGAWQVLPAPLAADDYRLEVNEHGRTRCYDLSRFAGKFAPDAAGEIYSAELRGEWLGIVRPSQVGYEAELGPAPCP